MIDEALGKILGMAMAYGVSSLGLLLAYYNYRKRIVKAEQIFTPAAKVVIGVVAAIVMVAVVGGAIYIGEVPVSKAIPGVIVPAIILAFSFWVTWALYRHFSKQIHEVSGEAPDENE
jgi:hypothetical protein